MKAEKMVEVTYASRAPEAGMTKKLFGYKGWQTRSGTKTYSHKPIIGALDGIPFQKLGRATIVLPLDYLPKAREAIAEAGGRDFRTRISRQRSCKRPSSSPT
jgi:hypothetical protein